MKIPGVLVALVVAITVPASASLAQAAPPSAPFKAVHLVALDDARAASLQTALADFNTAIAKAGHPEIRYRLFKVTGQQSGTFNYMWESSWPSREVYQKVHDDSTYKAAIGRYPNLQDLMKGQIYNRYVEVTPSKK